jgi:hypothetical protein
MTPWKTSVTVRLTGLAFLSAPSRPLRAQVWLHLPHGGVGYVVDYLSTGTLFCTQRSPQGRARARAILSSSATGRRR